MSEVEQKKRGCPLKESWMVMVIVCLNILVRWVYWSASVPYKIYGDTPGYVEFPFEDFLRGEFTSGRTPVYPLFIRLIQWVAGNNFYYGIVLVQSILSVLSVVLFYKALKLIIKNQAVVALAALMYGCANAVVGWDTAILTESLALSGGVCFIYLLFKYLHQATNRLAIGIPCFTFVLLFLRPTFLYFLAIVLIFFIVRRFEKPTYSSDWVGIVTTVICFVFVGIYAYFFSLTHGIFSISDAKVRQDLIVSMQQGYYQDASNPDFVQMIEEGLAANDNNAWAIVYQVIDEFGNPTVAQLTKEARNANLGEYFTYLKDLVIDHYNLPYSAYDSFNAEKVVANDWNTILTGPFHQLKFYHVYYIAIIELIVVLVIMIKEKRIDLIHSGLFVFIGGIVVSTFIATCGEWMRTSLLVVPFSYIAIAYYVDKGLQRLKCVEVNA